MKLFHYLLSVLVFAFVLIIPGVTLAQTQTVTPTQSPNLGTSLPKISNPFNAPDLAVNIPTLKAFQKVTCDESECTVSWLADYVNALYRYGTAVISIMAVIALMIGGVFYLTAAGKEERIADARKWITGGLSGLLIMVASYMILYTVNPALTELSPIKLAYVEKVDLGEVEFDDLAPSNPVDTSDCPPGVTGFNNALNHFTKNVSFKYSQPLRGTCSGENCYCDCSWFAQHLGKCGGLRPRNSEGTSATLIGDPNKVKITAAHCNSSPLSPGDIIVWRGNGKGHVLTYIGDNKMIECGGGSFGGSIIESHGALKITDWKSRCQNYLLKRNAYYIKR